MASENAKNVAKKVSENLRKGKKVILGEIIKEAGYSESVSKTPTVVTDTKSYQQEIQPIVDKMIRERDRLIEQISHRDLNEEAYKDMINATDTLTKNIQLLSGGKTENVGLEADREVLKSIISQIRGE